MIQGKTITLIIPTKNEAKGIAETIARVPKEIDEILVVDGSSKDGTPEIATKMGCRVIDEPRKGYGQAYLTALKNIRTDLVATCDGDGTYPVEAIPEIVARLERDRLDFINCARFPLHDMNSMFYKNFWGNTFLTLVFNTLCKTTVTDVLSGMWVFRSTVIPKMNIVSSNWNFSEEIKYEAIRSGARFAEHHIHYSERIGETKMPPWRTGIENLLFMFQMRIQRGNLKQPAALIEFKTPTAQPLDAP